MQVCASRAARVAKPPKKLPTVQRLLEVDEPFTQVGVTGDVALRVGNFYDMAIRTCILRANNFATRSYKNGAAQRGYQVDALVQTGLAGKGVGPNAMATG